MPSATVQSRGVSTPDSEPATGIDTENSTLNGTSPAGSEVFRGDAKGDPEKTGDVTISGDPEPFNAFANVPDGGARAWLVVLGAWCTSFCSFGWINSVGVFQDYYESGPLKSYSSSTIAWIPSLQIFFMMAGGPFVGRLFDMYGPRRIILIGTLLHVFGLMMASISTTYYQLLLSQGVCSAIGVSAIFQPALSCIPGWFDKRRGIAYGLLSTGSSLGGVIFPIMVSRLIASVGYGWAMRASAFLILGLLIVANITVESRMHAHPSFRPGTNPLTRAQMIEPFRETGFVFMLSGMSLLTFGIFVPITYLSVQASETGIVGNDLAQYLLSILNAGSLFGRLLSGLAADVIGRYNVFIIACGGAGVFILGLWIPADTQASIIAFAVMFGCFSGAYVSLIGSLVAHISPPKEIGYRTGLTFLVAAVPGLVTSPISGAILSGTGSWLGVKVISGVFMIVGASACVYTRVEISGPKLFVAV